MTRSGKTVTMKDVAREAGLSSAAVSLALRGDPSIPEPTRQRVRRAAERLGYVKNPLLMALTAHRSEGGSPAAVSVLAFVVNKTNPEAFLENPWQRAFYEGFERRSNELGFEAALVAAGGNDAASLRQQLDQLGCQAVVIGAWDPEGPTPTLDWSRYAVVRIESLNAEPPTLSVCNDQMHTVALAYEKLRELGYSRIGMVTGRQDEQYSGDLFLAGCLIEAARNAPSEEVPPLYLSGKDGFERQSDALANWIREWQVEAVVSNWRLIVERMQARGISVPADVAFASLCLSEESAELAGVVQRHDEVGAIAADKLVARLRAGSLGPDRGATTTYVKGSWREGASAPRKENL